MKDPEVIKDMEGLPIFGLFDFDKAFNTWNGFSEIDVIIDPYFRFNKADEGSRSICNHAACSERKTN